MKKKNTITLEKITAEQFDAYFNLDSPGYLLARDAWKAEEIATPQEAMEFVCLANILYQNVLFTHIVKALSRHSKEKAREYIENRGTDRGTDVVIETLGHEGSTIVVRAAMEECRRELMIGQNDKVARSRE
jgi:hypothetical protein